MIDPEKLLNWRFPEVEHRYTADDAILYALAIGLGADPTHQGQLNFVNDTRPGQPAVFPTMAVVLGFLGSWMQNPETGIDFSRIVHGEEFLLLHRPLPPSGTVIARHKVVDVTDKGAEKGAVITHERTLFEKEGGDLLATVRHVTFARGDGGFSGPAGLTRLTRTVKPTVIPESARVQRREIATLPQQALFYRLCADRNPLHSDPETATVAGFLRPILHGLCTFGIAAHAIVAQWCNYDPHQLISIGARFSSPVYPGETLVFESWQTELSIRFQARVKERDRLVLALGSAAIDVPSADRIQAG